jgi:hypothetical protein
MAAMIKLFQRFGLKELMSPDDLTAFLTALHNVVRPDNPSGSDFQARGPDRPAHAAKSSGLTSGRRRRRPSIPPEEGRRWKQALGLINDYRKGFPKFAAEHEAWRLPNTEEGWQLAPRIVDRLGMSLLRQWGDAPEAFAVASLGARFQLWWLSLP